MSGPSRLTVALAIALGLPAFARVVGQDQKTTTVEVQVKTVKVQDVEKVVTDKAAPAKRKGDAILKDAVRKIEKAVAPPQPARAVMKVNIGAMAVPAKADADGLDPMAQQFVGQFTPLVKTEVHLLLSVCEPTEDQRKQIIAGRGKAVKAAAKLYAQSQQRMGRFQNSTSYPQPRGLVQETLLAVAKPLLSEEQIGRYQAEVDRRAEDQKRLGIRNIIAKMDQDLALSGEQREKLDVALAKNWNAAWGQSLEMFMNGDQFFPAIPDGVVVPILSPKQAAVWRGTPRNGGQIWGGFGFFGGMDLSEDFPADENVEELKAEPAAANHPDLPPVDAPKDAPKDKPKADAVKKDAPKEKPVPTPKS